MVYLVLLFTFYTAVCQNDRIPKKIQARILYDSKIRFVGINPNESSIPKFELDAYAAIDTVKESYNLNIETEINYFRLNARTSTDYNNYSFQLYLKIEHDNSDFFIEKDSIYRFRNKRQFYDRDVFKKISTKLSFQNIPFGEYTIIATIKDNENNRFFTQKRVVTLRDATQEEILISDPILYDLKTNKKLISTEDAFMNREDSIKITFHSFSKDVNKSYLLLLRIYRRINANRFPERSLIEIEKDFYSFNKRYTKFSYRIAKSMFDHYEINLGLKDRIMQKIDVEAKRYTAVESDDETEQDGYISADTLSDSSFEEGTNKLTSRLTEIYIESLGYFAEKHFTFSWDTIPNTEYEMKQFSGKFKIILDDSLKDKFKDASFEEQIRLFRNYWITKSSHANSLSAMLDVINYRDKVKFAIDNFFDFRLSIGIVGKSPFFNNGWRSEKGLLYLKNGLPDEIYGENYIDTDGSLRFLLELPVQRWVYYNRNRSYVFIGNKQL